MIRKEDPKDLNVEDMRTEQDRLCSVHHKWLKELFIAVRGNGDIRHGLEYKVQTLLDNQKVVVRLMWIVAIAIIGKIIASPILEQALRYLIQKP